MFHAGFGLIRFHKASEKVVVSAFGQFELFIQNCQHTVNGAFDQVQTQLVVCELHVIDFDVFGFVQIQLQNEDVLVEVLSGHRQRISAQP